MLIFYNTVKPVINEITKPYKLLLKRDRGKVLLE